MSDVDKVVAAILTAGRCEKLGITAPYAIVERYQEMLSELQAQQGNTVAAKAAQFAGKTP